jgi:hypothetical protein
VDAISYSDPGRMIRQDQKHYCLFVLLQIHEGYPLQIAIQLCWVKHLNRVPGTDALCISKMCVVYTLPLKLMQDLDYEHPVHCTSSHLVEVQIFEFPHATLSHAAPSNRKYLTLICCYCFSFRCCSISLYSAHLIFLLLFNY